MRSKEQAFVRKWLGNPPKRVLDVGCGHFPFWKWRKQGFEAWGVDIHQYSKDSHFRREDARHMSFPDEFFDVVYSISSIEHVGIDRYGDELDVEGGDRKAVLEMGRVLKPDGVMVVTLPAAHPIDCLKKHRLYDEDRLNKLFSGFKIVEREYWIKKKGWRRSNMKEILAFTKGCRWLANVNVAVRKVNEVL